MEKWSVALKRRPEDPTLLSNRSAAWLALGERQKALDDAAKCVSVSPEWYKGHGRVGAALAALGRLDEAMASVSKGLELNPESQVLSSELERLKGEASAASGGPLPGLGDGSGGGGDGGGEGDEGGGGGGAQVALVGLALAKECNRLGRPEQAIRELDKLLSNKVADAELYCERALAHNKTHQLALAVQDAATAVYLYEHQHDPELKPWENPKELGIKLMTRQQKNELAKKEGYAFLLRGEAETRLCDYDKVRANTQANSRRRTQQQSSPAPLTHTPSPTINSHSPSLPNLPHHPTGVRTFQLGCKADARLGPEARKELRQAWYAAKELCRGWRRAGRLKSMEKRRMAFAAERRPVLHDIAKFEKEEDKALALRNLAGIHTEWGMHEEAVELLTTALTHTPEDHYLTHTRAKALVKLEKYDEACIDAQLVVRERPGWIEGVIHLGNIEGKLGRWKEAAIHWNEALILQPHNPNLRRDLERASVEMTAEVHKPSKQAQHTEPPPSFPHLTSHPSLMPLPPHTGGGRE